MDRGPQIVPREGCDRTFFPPEYQRTDCEKPAPRLRSEFDVTKPVARARLYASGLAYGVYFLNGRRVSENVLDPAITEYSDRAFYVTHDVTRLVRRGANAIGAELAAARTGRSASRGALGPGAVARRPRVAARAACDLPRSVQYVADRVQAIGDALAADGRARGNHLATGIMGTRFLWHALTMTGHLDEAFAVATQTT